MFKSTAKVLYDPYRPGLRKIRPGSLIVADVDPNIAKYYRWWVDKQLHLKLQNTAWLPHITVFDGKTPLSKEQMALWNKHQHERIHFEYNNEIEQHWKFWVLPVESKRLKEIRQELGLPTNKNFHITIGRME